jgi:hypothetical protein
MQKSRLHRAVLTFSVLASAGTIVVAEAFADPIRVSAGSVAVSSTDIATFLLRGSAVHLQGLLGSQFLGFRAFEDCLPCPSGSAVDAGLHLEGAALGGGSATVDGVTYPAVLFSGTLSIEPVGPVVAPEAEMLGTRSVRFPFLLNAAIAGFSDPSRSASPLFTLDLFGSGTGSVAFIPTPQRPGVVEAFSIEYFVESPQPVPEPGTLLLVTAGAIGRILSRARSGRTGGFEHAARRQEGNRSHL